MADWVSIRADYVSGGVSYSELAERHGVPLGSIKRHAAQERWAANRAEMEQNRYQKTVRKVLERKTDHEADRLTRLLAIGDNITDRLEEATSITPLDQYDFRTYASTLKTLQDVAKSNDPRGETELLSKAHEILGGIDSAID